MKATLSPEPQGLMSFGEISHTMEVIDLTHDSDLEEQESAQPHHALELLSLFKNNASLSSRSPSQFSAQILPQKRKSEQNSDNISVSNASVTNLLPSFAITNARSQSRPGTPVVNGRAEPPPISVVIPASPLPPSRSVDLRHGHLNSRLSKSGRATSESDSMGTSTSSESAPTGLSEKYYPVNALEIHALLGAYPSARKIIREDVELIQPADSWLSSGSRLKNKGRSKRHHIREALDKKLVSIKGPSVTLAWGKESDCLSLASNFEFIASYKLQKGVQRVDDSFNAGCDCGPVCNPVKCTCLSQELDSEALMIPYRRLETGLLVLSDEFLKKKAMIYECSSHCSCDERCWNRVVQHGRTVRLQIFNTGKRGFGLRSPDPIRAGQFIDCYLGEVITKEEADLREDAAGSQTSPSYLFSLDFLPNEDSDDDPDDDERYYVVDGQRFGSPARFMNHSCNPNCKMFPVSTNHGDSRLYDLAFFSLRDIPPMTELTFDYNPGWNPTDKKVDPNAVQCLCGEAKCRGQLWPNQRKSTNVD